MGWKGAGTIFRGGTQEARALAGRRVRARRTLLGLPVFDSPTAVLDVTALREGIVGHVPPGRLDQILIAFPVNPATRLTTLAQLTRAPFTPILVNWPTFRDAFEIEG